MPATSQFKLIIFLLLLTFSPAIAYAQEANVGLLRIAKFQPPRQVAPQSEFEVTLDVEYAIHGPENGTIRSAIYAESTIGNQSSPLWQSPPTSVTGGGDMIWNIHLTAPAEEDLMQLTAFAYYLNGSTWQYYNDSLQGPGYERSSVKVASTAKLQIDLGAEGLQIKLGNSTEQTGRSGTVNVTLPVNEAYNITVPADLELKNSTRLIFIGWSDGDNNTSRSIFLDGDIKLHASYSHQYLLQVTSPIPEYSTSKYYDPGSNVTLQANSTIPFSPPLNLIGLKYVFHGWTGDVNSQSNQVNLTMNSPKSVTANFSIDYSPLVLPCILSAGIIGAVILTILRRRKTTTNQAVETVELTQETNSQICGNCGNPVESEWKHCIHCGADLPGPRSVDK